MEQSEAMIVSKYTTPLRFSTIEVGLYRGAYPTLRNFRFLRCLQIKMMISMTPEPPTADLNEFCQQFGIVNLHIPVALLSQFLLPYDL
jgi:tyrosine-protein phosphatase OCA6